jgi:diaminohydroxyphosphoribosylaminopyrimidine deaminase / 5-amino-6-(5-phosphoribosylamino)uracil reductase
MSGRAEISPHERALLEQTLGLAELGRPAARPNPVVGALVAAADGTVLATGYHRRYGEHHAERVALDALEVLPPGATLFVSLEPCAHRGKQPPCTDQVIASGIRRVIIASADANPRTAGQGPARLAQAGVSVIWGPDDIARRAVQQNAGFHASHRWGRPYVTCKWAMTRNGRVATGDPNRRWISSPESRELVHYMRAGSGAVAVGVGTVLADDPLLTVRGTMRDRIANQPLRVVYDRSLRMTPDCQLVRSADEAPVLVFCVEGAPDEARNRLERAGVEVVALPHGPGFLAGSLEELAARGVNDVLLEAGPQLCEAFHAASLVDAVTCFVAPFEASPDQAGFSRSSPLVQALQGGQRTSSGVDTVVIRVLHEVT